MSSPKGRTIFEILSSQNKRNLTPLELQHYNPLKAKIGCTVFFDSDPSLKGINFVIEKISVYETQISGKKHYHTDYHLKGVTLDRVKPIRYRLRLIPDSDATNKLGSSLQLLSMYHEMEFDKDFYDGVLCSESKIFDINEDDAGNDLPEPWRYWRVGEFSTPNPYFARITVLSDKDGNGIVEQEELEYYDIEYWDYSREATDANGQTSIEFLDVEMGKKNHYFTFFRGREILASQVFVI